MEFAPFGLTIGEWATLAALFGLVVATVKKVFIPWLRQALEQSIASDRGIRVAIQEALQVELAQTAALTTSVNQLTATLQATNSEHEQTREAFGELRTFVHEFCDLMKNELHRVERRVEDVERAQEYHHRRSTDP